MSTHHHRHAPSHPTTHPFPTHPDEEPLDPHIFGEDQPCFGCSPTHPNGLHLHFWKCGPEVITRTIPDEDHQGPPGVMHGGLVMTLADELAAWTIVAQKGRFGFTVSMECRLAKPVRIGTWVEGRGRIESDTPRFTKIAVELHQSGSVCFKGTFTFAVLDQAGAEKVLGGPLPEAWKRFAR